MPERNPHLISLNGKTYCLYAGVLALAHERGLKAIEVELIQAPTPQNEQVAIVRATVIMKEGESFTDYGDASPKNAASRIATALIRLASTRAKGRALRDAVNVGQTMVEELPEPEAAAEGQRPGARRPPPGTPEGQAVANRALEAATQRMKEAYQREQAAPTENGKAKAAAAVEAAETGTVADQVANPNEAGPLWEAWYVEPTKGRRLQRIAMVNSCLADIAQLEDWGHTVEPIEPKSLTNRDLYEFGQAIREALKAARKVREGANA